MHVETRPWGRGARFLQHQPGKFGCAAIHEVGSLVQQCAARIGPGFGPAFKGFCGSFRDRIDIRKTGGGSNGCNLARYRILALEVLPEAPPLSFPSMIKPIAGMIRSLK
ncbi:hypothetical protein AX23_08145 [Brucella melitensis 548]|nr:hypothetical protein AX23_08145 [Brucella melitensis 548]